MDKGIIKHYTNGELTIVWKPAACIHSKKCWNAVTGMPQVFDPRKRPWINMQTGPGSAEIAAQVAQCPSRALTSYYNADKPVEQVDGGPASTGLTAGPLGEPATNPNVAPGNSSGQATTSTNEEPGNPIVGAATNATEAPAAGTAPMVAQQKPLHITVLANGPLLVQGMCVVEDAAGNSVSKSDTTAFCRCGFSGNKPYCDGSHSAKNFVG